MTGRATNASLAGLTALVLLLTSLAFTRNGVWSDMVTLWEDAAAKAPGKERVKYELGRAYGFQGRWDKAYQYLAQAKQQDPGKFNRLLRSQADIYRQEGRLSKAEAEYRVMIAREPDRPVTRVDLGCVLYEEGKLADAYREFSEAIRLDPGYATAYANRGVVNVETGKAGAGVDDLLQAVRIEPGNAEYRAKLAFSYAVMGYYQEALGQYDQALRIDPGNERAKRERAEVVRRMGRQK